MRKPNTNRVGDFSKKEELQVWKKAKLTDDPNIRLDICGRKMHFDKYGETSSKYGQEIDHIKPVAEGGADDLSNLQALYWKTNRSKNDDWPTNPESYCSK